MIRGSLPDGVIARDRSSRIVMVNDAALELLGCASAGDIECVSAADLIAEFDIRDKEGLPLDPNAMPTSQLLTGAAAMPQVVSLRRRSEQARRWMFISGCAVRDFAGNVRLTIKRTQHASEQYRAIEVTGCFTRSGTPSNATPASTVIGLSWFRFVLFRSCGTLLMRLVLPLYRRSRTVVQPIGA